MYIRLLLIFCLVSILGCAKKEPFPFENYLGNSYSYKFVVSITENTSEKRVIRELEELIRRVGSSINIEVTVSKQCSLLKANRVFHILSKYNDAFLLKIKEKVIVLILFNTNEDEVEAVSLSDYSSLNWNEFIDKYSSSLTPRKNKIRKMVFKLIPKGLKK